MQALHELVIAEAMAALRAMELCKEVGINDILLKGDSLLVVRAVSDSGQSWLRYGQIIEDIKWVMRSLHRWSIRHVKREANLAADGLAKHAIMSVDTHVWPKESPSCILNVVILEQMALSL